MTLSTPTKLHSNKAARNVINYRKNLSINFGGKSLRKLVKSLVNLMSALSQNSLIDRKKPKPKWNSQFACQNAKMFSVIGYFYVFTS